MEATTMNVSWNNFQTVTAGMFSKLHTSSEFSDVTLVSEDHRQVKAHKVILSCCSRFFESVLVTSPHPSPLLYLRGTKYQELEAIVTFIYKGEVEVEEDQLELFMAAARNLGIKGLLQEGVEEVREEKKETKKETKKEEAKEKVKNHKRSSFQKAKDPLGAVEEDSKDKMKQVIETMTKKRQNKKLCPKPTKQTSQKPFFYDNQKVDENLVDLASVEEMKKDETGKYSCNQCAFKNADLMKVRNHFTVHETVKFACPRTGCDQKYSNINGRKRHEKNVHGNEPELFGCDKCDQTFNVAEELKKHIVLKHAI